VPTIDRIGPYRIFFCSHDLPEPPHVHVVRDRTLAKFWLDPVGLASSEGFSAQELNTVRRLVTQRATEYQEQWNEFFRHSK